MLYPSTNWIWSSYRSISPRVGIAIPHDGASAFCNDCKFIVCAHSLKHDGVIRLKRVFKNECTFFRYRSVSPRGSVSQFLTTVRARSVMIVSLLCAHAL